MPETQYNPTPFQGVVAGGLTELLLNQSSANISHVDTPVDLDNCSLEIGIERSTITPGFIPPSDGDWVLVAAQLANSR